MSWLAVHVMNFEHFEAYGMTNHPMRAKRALGSGENSVCTLLIDSDMAGWIRLKLGRMIKAMGENILAKEFF